MMGQSCHLHTPPSQTATAQQRLAKFMNRTPLLAEGAEGEVIKQEG